MSQLSISPLVPSATISPVVACISLLYVLYWTVYLICNSFCNRNENLIPITEKHKENKEKNDSKDKKSILSVQESVEEMADNMTDDEVHDLLARLSKRFLILNWYEREHVSCLLGSPVDQKEWDTILRRHEEMADATNDLVREWADHTIDELSNHQDEEQESEQSTLEDVLYTLSNSQLRLYAGVTSTSKTKAELVDLILQQLQHNMKKVIDRKLDRLASMLD